MKILAVESSCDETAVAVVEDGRTVLTDCIASQVALHRLYGGVVPELASRKHIEAIYALADEALSRASITRQEIDAIAVTYAPGLIGAVLVGVNFAKAAGIRFSAAVLRPEKDISSGFPLSFVCGMGYFVSSPVCAVLSSTAPPGYGIPITRAILSKHSPAASSRVVPMM